MRVNLKGIHRVTRTLATGERVTYYYAWRRGPRLVGEPGSAEFLASFEASHRNVRTTDRSLFRSVISDYKASRDFSELRERTRSDYMKQIAKIEAEFGDLPLDALADQGVTRDFLDWRDGMPSPRQADYAWTVLMRIIHGRGPGGSPATGRPSVSSASIMRTARRRYGATIISRRSWPWRRSRFNTRSCSHWRQDRSCSPGAPLTLPRRRAHQAAGLGSVSQRRDARSACR